MSAPADRLAKADRNLMMAGTVLTLASAFIWLARLKIQTEIEEAPEKSDLQQEIQMLRARLDEALERLHESASPDQAPPKDGSLGAPLDDPGATQPDQA